MDVVFCLYCDALNCRCSCMGSMSVSSCRYCMFVSCVHAVAVLNAAFCMTCSLLMLIEDARDDNMEEAYLLLGFGMGTMLANFHMCGIMLVLRAVFNMLVRNVSPRGPMCFRCLMLCQDRASCYVYCVFLDLSCSECDVMSL